MRSFRVSIILLAVGVVMQGCASGGTGTGYDPGAAHLPMGKSCKSIRSELNRLDAKGVPALVERSQRGGKLSSSQKASVDLYNQLLTQYLGARCHV